MRLRPNFKAALRSGVKLYAVVCSALVSYLILIFLWDIVDHYGAPQHTARQASLIKQAQIVNLSLPEVMDLHSETIARTWEYAPWVGYRAQASRGTYVNISRGGYRRTAYAPERGDHLILLFGGSSMFGYNVRDEQTIASYFQSHLNAVYGEGTFEVRNYGRASYYSTQELALFLDLLHKDRRPTAVIFLDGLNEGQDEPWHTRPLKQVFKYLQEEPSQLWLMLKLWWTRDNVENLLDSPWLGRSSNRKQASAQRMSLELISKRYALSHAIIESVCKSLGIEAFHFLQPIPGFRNGYPLRVRDPIRKAHIHNKLRHLVAERAPYIRDLTGILEQYQGEAFVDKVHYSPAVNKLIAGAFFEQTKPALDLAVK